MAVGVFDSGLGGLTVHQAIAARLPDLPLVYLGDNKHTPYGVRDPQDITETETRFSEAWTAIKACVETHLQRTALDESLDREPFAAISISGHPPANQEMTLSVRYERSGLLKADIDEP